MRTLTTDKTTMNAIALEAQALARRCMELDRSEGDKKARLVRAARVPIGTVENTLRGRLKAKAAYAAGVFRQVLIEKLEHEARAIEHELDMLRRTSARPDSDEIFEAMQSLKKVRETLDRCKG